MSTGAVHTVVLWVGFLIAGLTSKRSLMEDGRATTKGNTQWGTGKRTTILSAIDLFHTEGWDDHW